MTDSHEKTVIERMSEASVSDDLSHRETHCDADVLQAMGIAAIRQPLGHALLRLDLTQDRRDIPRAIEATMDFVGQIATQQGWPMHMLKRRKIATAVLVHYLSPACPACKGRGMIGVERDKPDEYKPRPCNACGGSGTRQLPQKYQREIRHVLAVMQRRQSVIGGIVAKVLSFRR